MARPGFGRLAVVAGTATAIVLPIGIVVYQSFLDAPFFQPSARLSLAAWRLVLSDGDFHRAFTTTAIVAAGMTAIAVPLGAALAFVVVRGDLPLRRILEPLFVVPVFVSPVVQAFGYVVAIGPVGFFTLWLKEATGLSPGDLYSLRSLVLIAGLTHAPHVYLYTSSALRALGSDVEDAARSCGASALRIALTVSLPMAFPAILYSGVLVFFLGFELFGLALILGDPEGLLVISTYLYKLTNRLGVPSYQLMAVVAISVILVSFPLIFLQRRLIGSKARFVSVRGKGLLQRPLPLGRLRWPAFTLVIAWLAATVLLPLCGVALRSVVTSWGEGVRLSQVLTLDHFRELLEYPNLVRGIGNTLGIAVVGGALSVAWYTCIGLSLRGKRDFASRLLDYLAMVPRGMPGLIAGLAFLWVFLFVRPLSPLRGTLFSIWLAYSVVWLAYGLRLIESALLQVAPELEEAARSIGANGSRAIWQITIPLVRFGLLGSWLLVFLLFVREYSTGVYLLGPGTEVIGALIVSLWGTGAVDTVAALSVIDVALVAAGLAVALRLGVRPHA